MATGRSSPSNRRNSRSGRRLQSAGFEIRQETFDGALDVSADATLSARALARPIAPGWVGILGRRFDVNSPLALSLRRATRRIPAVPCSTGRHTRRTATAPFAAGHRVWRRAAVRHLLQNAALHGARRGARSSADQRKPGVAAIDSFGDFLVPGSRSRSHRLS